MAGIAAVVTSVAGTALQYQGYQQAAEAARVAGRRANVAAQFEAEQLEQQAGQVFAASQRNAMEEKRRADLLASRALALAAASGGGVSDPTVVNVIAGLKSEGSYRAAVALYRGQDEARKLRTGASARRFEGAVAEEGGILEGAGYETMAASSLLQGASSLFSRYGGGGGDTSGPASKGYG